MQLAMKAVPYHKDFLKYLGSDGSAGGDDQVIQDMAQFADSLEVIVTIINLFYQHHNLDVWSVDVNTIIVVQQNLISSNFVTSG